MNAVVAKWGNSLAVRLPRHLAADARLSEGTRIDMHIEGGALVVRPARPRYTLKELLEGYKPEHRHEEVDWGPPVGKEVW
jgi:antitoxin MazE